MDVSKIHVTSGSVPDDGPSSPEQRQFWPHQFSNRIDALGPGWSMMRDSAMSPYMEPWTLQCLDKAALVLGE